MSLKANVRPLNLLALPYITFFSTSLVGFLNTQMIFMLRDSNSFDVPEDKLGVVTAKVLLVA